MNDEYLRGLRDAMACVTKAQGQISEEYLRTPRTLLGRPTRRHDQLTGMSVSLSGLANDIITLHMAEALKDERRRMGKA